MSEHNTIVIVVGEHANQKFLDSTLGHLRLIRINDSIIEVCLGLEWSFPDVLAFASTLYVWKRHAHLLYGNSPRLDQ